MRVSRGGSLYTAEWKGIIEEFAEKIDANTNTDVKDWVTVDFSTTTSVDRMIS